MTPCSTTSVSCTTSASIGAIARRRQAVERISRQATRFAMVRPPRPPHHERETGLSRRPLVQIIGAMHLIKLAFRKSTSARDPGLVPNPQGSGSQ